MDKLLRRRKAFAILTVVLILFGLMIIGTPFLVTMRLQNRASKNQLWQAKAKYSALAAANHAMAQLVETLETVEADGSGTYSTPSIDDPSEFQVTLEDLGDNYGIDPKGIMISVSVEDEQGKVNLNSATHLLLQNIFQQAELSNPSDLADAVVYFRTYRHSFRTLGEIQLCADMDLPSDRRYSLATDELARLREFCTVHSTCRSADTYARHPINVNTASREVLVAALTGVTHRDLKNPETIRAKLLNENRQIVGEIVGTGVLSDVSFPSGFSGGTWYARCTEADAGNFTFEVSVSGSSVPFAAETFTFSRGESLEFVSRGGEISFRITNGRTTAPPEDPALDTEAGVDFGLNDGFVVTVHEEGSAVTAEAAEKLADRIRISAVLAEDLTAGATQVKLDSSDNFPFVGWASINGDLVQFEDNELTNELLNVTTSPEFRDAGVDSDHPAGTKVVLVLTDWADLEAVLAAAETDGDITAENREAVYQNAANPSGPFVARSTTGFVFRSGDVYSIEAAGIINSDQGQELAKAVTRRIIQPNTTVDATWVISSQTDFLELLQQAPQSALITHSNLSSIRDLNNVNDKVEGVLTTEPPNTGALQISLLSVENFRIGQRVEIIHPDDPERHECANVVRIDTLNNRITIDHPLRFQYSGEPKVYPAGALSLGTARVVIDASKDTAAQHFDEGALADFLDLEAEIQDGEKSPSATNIDPAVDARNVDIEGLFIGEEDLTEESGALAYRAYDYDADEESHTAQNLAISSGNIESGQIEFWFKPYWPSGIERDYHLIDMVSNFEEYQNRLSLKINKTGVEPLEKYLVLRLTDGVLRDADFSTVDEAHLSEVRVPITTTGMTDKLLLESGVWHHVRFMWKGTDYGQIALFVDGRLVGSYWPAAILQKDNIDLSTEINQVYEIDSLVLSSSEYPPEFNNSADFASKAIGDEIIEHTKVVPTSPQYLSVPGGPDADTRHRAKRKTVARQHYAGEAVTIYGYVYGVNQEYHPNWSWYLRAKYPDEIRLFDKQVYYQIPHLMKGETKNVGGVDYVEYSTLAHALSHQDRTPNATIKLSNAEGFPIVGEQVDGNPNYENFTAATKLAAGAKYIPYEMVADKDDFPTSGFVIIKQDDVPSERLFFHKNESKDFDVYVDRGQPDGVVVETVTLDVLHVYDGDPTGRGNLGTDPQEYDVNADISLISVELRYGIYGGAVALAGNSNYAWGTFRPFIAWEELTQEQRDALTAIGTDKDAWESGGGAEGSWYAYVALDGTGPVAGKSNGWYEWVGYTWPNTSHDSFHGSGSELTQTRDDGKDPAQRLVEGSWKHYLIGGYTGTDQTPPGLNRNAQGNIYGLPANAAHPGASLGSGEASTVVFPVFFSNHSRIGVSDRITFRDDDGHQEEKVVLYASSSGELFTIADKEEPEVPAFLTGQYEYIRNARILKFPTGRTPALVKNNTELWVGSSGEVASPIESKSDPADAADSVFDEIKVRKDSLAMMRLHSVLIAGANGNPPLKKRVHDSDPYKRLETQISEVLAPPFTIRIGNLARFLNWGWNSSYDQAPAYSTDSNTYYGRWYGTTLGIAADTKLAPWMWLNNSGATSWPRFGHLKIDDEVFYCQMLYTHPNTGARAYLANVSNNDISEGYLGTEVQDGLDADSSNDIKVVSTEGFADSGYAYVQFWVKNTSYDDGTYDQWMRTPEGAIKQEDGANVENPRYPYWREGRGWADPYHGHGDRWHPHHQHYWEVIFYKGRDETTLYDVQRGIMDTVPYPLPGPANSDFDFSVLNLPSTFEDGITAAPGPTGQERASGLAGNAYVRIVPLNAVELQIVQRGCMGTKLARHAIGAPLMPIEGDRTAIITGPLQEDGTLPVHVNSLADPNDISDETAFPARGMLELSTGEVVGYSSRGPSAFYGVHVLRERYGTEARTTSGKDDLKQLDAITDIDEITPNFFSKPLPTGKNGCPHIARLLPYRYFDGFPKEIDDSGASIVRVTDYNAPGAVYLRAARQVRAATWKSIQWAEQLPDPADNDRPFKTHVVVRIGGDAAPSWGDWDPDASESEKEELRNRGLFRFTSADDADTGDAIVGPFYFTEKGEEPDADNPAFTGDRIEIRVFFEFPEDAYDPDDDTRNDWKKTPYLDSLKVTYQTEPRVLQSEDVSF